MCRCLFQVAMISAFATPALAQDNDQLDRRDRREPAIILNTGGRTGAADVVKFTLDGKFLLACGDDKQVTVYPVTEKGLDSKFVDYLRWPTWREQRGSLYAMDISPDGKLVAFAGMGMLDSAVAVADRETKKIVYFTDLRRTAENLFAVMSLAFSPDGKQLAAGTGSGAVCLWNFRDPPEIIGRHAMVGKTYTRVRALWFENDAKIHSIAETAKIATWTRDASGWNRENTLELKSDYRLRCAAFCPATNLVVAGSMGDEIIVGNLKDHSVRSKRLEKNLFPRSLAASPDGRSLAVGVGRLEQKKSGFYLEQDENVYLFDLNSEALNRVGTLERAGRAEAIAWKDNSKLAVAGGDNHEIELWDSARRDKPMNVVRGAGSGIWRVAVTKDNRYIAFVDRRDPRAESPNQRGTREWRWFDTSRRRFEKEMPPGAELVEPIEIADGWTVKPDPKLAWQWHVVDPNSKSFPLPWDMNLDDRPTCYTFINPKGGPLRLAVGHYWGFSLFELGPNGPRRVRLYTGHSGPVTSIAPSDDGSWVVTASNDQTVSAWSLKDWPSKNGLGATFELGANGIVVKQVDTGSPAWEMGLLPGDEIFKLVVNTKEFFEAGKLGDATLAKQRLENPDPGMELFVFLKRAGRERPFLAPSTVRTRPLWRFFPGPNREWVLWMWQGSYYDTSTNGDSFAGWLINDPNRGREPRYFRLEQFREQFQRQDVIDELIDKRNTAAALAIALGAGLQPVNLGLNEPPAVRMEQVPDVLKAGATIRLIAKPRGENPDFQPVRVELWINSFRAKAWDAKGQAFDETFQLEPALLHSGANKLVLQAFNRLGGRAEYVKNVENPNSADSRAVRGAAVGINDYSKSPQKSSDGKRNLLVDLRSAVNDAEKQQREWDRQKGKLYAEATVQLLPNAHGNRAEVLKVLDQIANDAKPDDLMVLVLSGHGDFVTRPSANGKKPVSTFVFCGPNYKRDQFRLTGIDHRTLYEKLAAINCRKIVFLDACHSGEAAFNPVRSLTPAGQGPIVIAACDRSELAYEDPKYQNGLFTFAVLKAMNEGFKNADVNKDGMLDASELYEYVVKQMPELLRSIGKADDLQNPQMFPRNPDDFPLIKR